MTTESARTDEEILEILLQEENKAAEPQPDDYTKIIHRGDADLPAPIVAGALSSAGWRWLWHSESGEKSLFNNNMVPLKLKLRREDGQAQWLTRPPQGITPKVPTLKCLLHKDAPNRDQYDTMGFVRCTKNGGFFNEYDRRRHMESTHRKEWATIREAEEEAKREEDRALNRSIVQMAMGNISTETTTTAKPVVSKTIEPKEEFTPEEVDELPEYVPDKKK